ncbi:MAG TPA: hypothetical protein H9841_00035, partial [Candidatus Flavonifractor merdigallinarum]|nr:hypothetical protein [Candidatus Flavonifractor merdigallinarum]
MTANQNKFAVLHFFLDGTEIFLKKGLTFDGSLVIISFVRCAAATQNSKYGGIAQLGERLNG